MDKCKFRMKGDGIATPRYRSRGLVVGTNGVPTTRTDEIDRFRDSGEWSRDRAEKFGSIETGLSSVAVSRINEDRAMRNFSRS